MSETAPIQTDGAEEEYSFVENIFGENDEIVDPPGPEDVEDTTDTTDTTDTEEQDPSEDTEEQDSSEDTEEQDSSEEVTEDDFFEKEEKEGDSDEFPDADEIEALEGNDKAKAKWNELRGELTQAREEISQLKTQAPTRELEIQLKTAQEDAETLRNELGRYRVEHTREYQQQVEVPMMHVVNAVKEIATAHNLDEESAIEILGMSGRAQEEALQEITSDMSEMSRIKMYRLVEDSQYLWKMDEYLKENASQALEIYESNREAYLRQEAEKELVEIRKNVDLVFDRLAEKAPIDANAITELKEKASKEDFSNLAPAHKAYALMAGTALPKLITQLKTANALVAEKDAEIKKLSGASPDPSKETRGPKGSDQGEDLSFFETIDRELTQAGHHSNMV